MPDRLVWGNTSLGLSTGLTAFNIDNDAFPTLINAYIWRQRLKRKRGTQLLGRLETQLFNQSLGDTGAGGTFSGNILSILSLTPPGNQGLSPGSVTVTVTQSMPSLVDVFTDTTPPTGVLTGNNGGTGTINYVTGALTLTGAPDSSPVTITLGYYPCLPVLGLEDFEVGAVNQPQMISFDTTYSYGFNQGTNHFFNVNYFKGTGDPFTWNCENYQQFYSANYLGVNTIDNTAQNTGCMWVTNGNPGWQIIAITAVTLANANMSNTVATITADGHGLSTNDYVFINEVNGITVGSAAPVPALGVYGLNGQSGRVLSASTNTFTLAAPYATGSYTGGGIVQYLTQNPSGTMDGIRWFDGYPTPNALSTYGWVNFAPPLSAYDPTLNPNPYYLVGADIITPFKNRLLFSGVYLAQSNHTTPVYYPNRVVYSQVGSPFYTAPLPYLLSTNRILPDPTAWYQNVAGKGGFITAPVDEEIISVSDNEDVLIYIMEKKPLRLVFQFDDSFPFFFQTISPEYGGQSTFSAIPLDSGVLSIGEYGFLLTDQIKVGRIDLNIPEQVFDISILTSTDQTVNNSASVTAYRDYENEWVYFTYIPGQYETTKSFPSRTVLYNYRENNFAVFNENYTHYGTFRRTTTQTWANLPYATWADWTIPWNSGQTNANSPQIVAGNQHGFVMIRWDGVQEANSQYISAINVSTSYVTSPNHCLDNYDYIQINNADGITLNSPNGIYQIAVIDSNTFQCYLEPGAPSKPFSGTYLGGGVYKRYSVPYVQSKQYRPYWEQGRGVRVGTQKYLLDTTTTGQITATMFASQNSDVNLNDNQLNNYQTNTNVVLTTPEPNLYGDTSLSGQQDQTWHRMSNSFTGDTIQWGFTLSGQQMFDDQINESEIVLNTVILELYPGKTLSV